MKKLISLIVVVAAVLLLVFTCPNKEAHQDKIKTTMTNLVEEHLTQQASEDEKGLALLGSLFASKMVDVAMEQKLEVDNYVVCSVGKVTFEGKTRYISFGILNQVFVMGQDEIRNAMKSLGN